jgi:hypothetical protein
MASAATQQREPFDKLGEIIKGWTGALCPLGPSGERPPFLFDISYAKHDNPTSSSRPLLGKSSSGDTSLPGWARVPTMNHIASLVNAIIERHSKGPAQASSARHKRRFDVLSVMERWVAARRRLYAKDEQLWTIEEYLLLYRLQEILPRLGATSPADEAALVKVSDPSTSLMLLEYLHTMENYLSLGRFVDELNAQGPNTRIKRRQIKESQKEILRAVAQAVDAFNEWMYKISGQKTDLEAYVSLREPQPRLRFRIDSSKQVFPPEIFPKSFQQGEDNWVLTDRIPGGGTLWDLIYEREGTKGFRSFDPGRDIRILWNKLRKRLNSRFPALAPPARIPLRNARLSLFSS